MLFPITAQSTQPYVAGPQLAFFFITNRNHPVFHGEGLVSEKEWKHRCQPEGLSTIQVKGDDGLSEVLKSCRIMDII